ncbi:MAG: hypothetical protein ACT4NY_24385 [Pseudonocardiales bacterium]
MRRSGVPLQRICPAHPTAGL